MSGMLASVCTLSEAVLVQDAGVDIIDLKNPHEGALGALDLTIVREIVAYVNGAIPISATIGDLPFEAKVIDPVIREMAKSGVDIIKVGVFGELNQLAELQLLSRLSQQGIRIVLVMFAEQYEKGCDFKIIAKTGITGVMLDTMDKRSGNLRTKLSDSVLRQFVYNSKSQGLLSGLAGSLGEEDIAALLEINPDYLGFRGGLCQQGQRENLLDKQATSKIRQQIPPGAVKIMHSAAII
ncbi:MAG: hypothetical protein ACI9SC_002197 [Gammaproteobacteria bacterium]|jgi:uncharacterized protein (UPF0264 family)